MIMKKPYFIAELAINFYDSAKILGISPLEAAKLYIDAAKGSGADAVKFQAFKADSSVSKRVPDSSHAFLKEYDSFGSVEHRTLAEYAKSKGIDYMCTAFDFDSADYLEELTPIYKVASPDLSYLPLLRHIAAKGKPMIMSVGAAYLSEIDEAVRVVTEAGCPDITLLHCVSVYPCLYEDANLNVITTLKRVFPNVRIGYSDHTVPDENMAVLATAYLLGAEVIEKHFTLDKTIPGDLVHYSSGDPGDFAKAAENFKFIDRILGSGEITVLDCEMSGRIDGRRSLVLTRDMKAGDIIEKADLADKRPATGIPPELSGVVIGRKVCMDLPEDTVLTWDMLFNR